MNAILRRMLTTMGALACLAGTLGGPEPVVAQEDREDAAAELRAKRYRLGLLHWPSANGVDVATVLMHGPGYEAGIRRGDRIVSVNGHPLDEPVADEDERELPEGLSRSQARLGWLVDEIPADESFEVGVERDGESLTFTVEPGDYPMAPWETEWWSSGVYESLAEAARAQESLAEQLRDAMGRVNVRGQPHEFEFGWVAPRVYIDGLPTERELLEPQVELLSALDYGDWWRDRFHHLGGNLLELTQLNPELGAYFGTEEGILVLDVEEDGTLGLRPGDVVVEIGGRKVDDVSDMRRILRSYEEDEAVDFGIWRDGARATAVGTIR